MYSTQVSATDLFRRAGQLPDGVMARRSPTVTVRLVGKPSDAGLEAIAQLLFERERRHPASVLVQSQKKAGTLPAK